MSLNDTTQKWVENYYKHNYWNSSKSRGVQEKESQVIINWLLALKRQHYNILEVGCGNGYVGALISQALQNNGLSVNYHATDLIPECIEQTKKEFSLHHVDKGALFSTVDVYTIDKQLGKETQEIIISTGFVSAATYKEAVPKIFRVLKPGGILICDFVNHLSPFVLLSCFPSMISSLPHRFRQIHNSKSDTYHVGSVGIKEYFMQHN